MAIDSEGDRRSAMMMFTEVPMPVADGIIMPGDRRHVCEVYRDKLPGTPGPLAVFSYFRRREDNQ